MDNLTKYNERMKGPSKTRIFVSIGLTLLILISFFSGFLTHAVTRGRTTQITSEVVEVIDKVGFIYDPKIDDYVKIEGDKIAQLIAGNFLDGYSEYYTKEEYEKVMQENAGKYVGIGISFNGSDDAGSNQIIQVSLNSPAHYAKIEQGDIVIGARVFKDDKDDASIKQDEYTVISTGKQLSAFLNEVGAGDTVQLKIDRAGEILEISVQKKAYQKSYVSYIDSQKFAFFAPLEGDNISSVNTAFETIEQKDITFNAFYEELDGESVENKDVAIIKLSAFEGDAAYQLGAMIRYMTEIRNRSSLILDLCDNGGGDMNILTNVTSYLINNNGNGNYKIVIANGKLDGDGVEKEEAYRVSNYSVGKNNFNTDIKKITIMANRNTASASECLMGAMICYADDCFSQDNVVIVASQQNGELQPVYRTYGKGIMQTTYRLQSGGALKLTTAKILWPNNTCIHKTGIVATNPQNQADSYNNAIIKAFEIAKNIGTN